MHLVLGDDLGTIALLLGGHDVRERLRRDDHCGGVDRILPPESLEAACRVDDLGRTIHRLEQFAQSRSRCIVIAIVRRCIRTRWREALVDRRVLAEDGRRHGLGQLITGRVRIVEHPGCVPEGLLALDGGERDDLRDVVGSVLLGAVGDHLGAVALVEVHVDVRHLLAPGVQEAFEDEPVVERIEVGDRQAVGDDRSGSASASGSRADAAPRSMGDQVPDDEEVRRESHVGDHAELVVDALRDVSIDRAVPAMCTLHHEVPEVLVLVVAIGHRELRQEDLVELDLDIGTFGDPQGVVTRPRVVLVREQVSHLARRLDVELVGVELETVLIGFHGAGLDTQQRIVRIGLVRSGVVRIVRGEERGIDRSADLEEVRHDLSLRWDPVVLEFDEEVLASEDVLVHPRRGEGPCEVTLLAALIVIGWFVDAEELGHVAAEATGRRDEPLGVLGEQFGIHARLVVVALRVRPRCELHEVAVPHVALGEDGHVVPHVVAARWPIEPTTGCEVRLDADDRFDPLGLGSPDEVDDTVHHAVVGDGHGGLAIGPHGLDDVLDTSGTVEHRELGVHMEVGEAVGQAHPASRITRM